MVIGQQTESQLREHLEKASVQNWIERECSCETDSFSTSTSIWTSFAVTSEMARCLPIAIVMVGNGERMETFFPFDRLPTEMKWLVLRNLDTSELLIVAPMVSNEWKGLAKKIIEGRQKTINLSSFVQEWPEKTGEFMTGGQFIDILLSLSQLKLNLCLAVDDDVET